jgi:hypothetical protein
VPVATAPEVVRGFYEPAALWGLPASVLSDNGAISTTADRGSHRGMEIELAPLGITHGKPHHPQTQGKVERFHLRLKKWLAQKPAVATLAELESQIDRFVFIYNEERPHSARGCPPMEAWRALDKAVIEIDGQPLLDHTRVRRDALTRRAASPCAIGPSFTTSWWDERTRASASWSWGLTSTYVSSTKPASPCATSNSIHRSTIRDGSEISSEGSPVPENLTHHKGAPGRTRTCATGSGGRCSIR